MNYRRYCTGWLRRGLGGVSGAFGWYGLSGIFTCCGRRPAGHAGSGWRLGMFFFPEAVSVNICLRKLLRGIGGCGRAMRWGPAWCGPNQTTLAQRPICTLTEARSWTNGWRHRPTLGESSCPVNHPFWLRFAVWSLWQVVFLTGGIA